MMSISILPLSSNEEMLLLALTIFFIGVIAGYFLDQL